MPGLTRDAILAASDLKRERVDVPEWGGYVNVRAMTAGERDDFEAHMLHIRAVGRGRNRDIETSFNRIDVRAKLASLTVVDDDGERIFSEADIAELSAKSAAVMDRIYAVAQRLSGLSNDDVGELAGESKAEQN